MFTEEESAIVFGAMEDITKKRIKKAFNRYDEERRQVIDVKKLKPFLKYLCENPESRGINPVACQLINVAAATNWHQFRNQVALWLVR